MTLVKEKGWVNKLPGYWAKMHTRSQMSNQTATSQGEWPTIYDEANFHQLLLKFIIVDDQVCSHCFILMSNMLMQTFQSLNVVECCEFCELFHYLWPDLKESMVPHWTKLRGLVVNSWSQYFQALKFELAVGAPQPSQCFHLMFSYVSRWQWAGCLSPWTYGQIKIYNLTWQWQRTGLQKLSKQMVLSSGQCSLLFTVSLVGMTGSHLPKSFCIFLIGQASLARCIVLLRWALP